MNDCCFTCRYWDPYDKETKDMLADGECRRYPPNVPTPDEYVRNTPLMTYPITYGVEWCGEHAEGMPR